MAIIKSSRLTQSFSSDFEKAYMPPGASISISPRLSFFLTTYIELHNEHYMKEVLETIENLAGGHIDGEENSKNSREIRR